MAKFADRRWLGFGATDHRTFGCWFCRATIDSFFSSRCMKCGIFRVCDKCKRCLCQKPGFRQWTEEEYLERIIAPVSDLEANEELESRLD